MEFFRLGIEHFRRHFSGRVIDIGSLDINGGPHDLLESREYVGVDLAPGKNVNFVSPGEKVALPTSSFDVAMSSECFEHNPKWKETLRNMVRMTKPGGLIIFSCATFGRPEHGTSASDGGYAAPLAVAGGQEYYGNVGRSEAHEVARQLDLQGFWTVVEPRAHDLYFAGLKRFSTGRDMRALRRLRRRSIWSFSKGFLRGPMPRRALNYLAGRPGKLAFDSLFSVMRLPLDNASQRDS